MSEINLLQNQNYEVEAKQTYAVLNRVGIVFLLVVLIAYGVLHFLVQSVQSQVTSDTAAKQELQQKILSNADYPQLLQSQSKLKNLQILLDKHLSWGSLIQKFGDATLKTATYSRFAANSEGGATITGLVPDFQDLDKLMKAYQLNDFQYIKDVKLVNIGLSKEDKSSGINFTVKVTFNKSLLQVQPVNAATSTSAPAPAPTPTPGAGQ